MSKNINENVKKYQYDMKNAEKAIRKNKLFILKLKASILKYKFKKDALSKALVISQKEALVETQNVQKRLKSAYKTVKENYITYKKIQKQLSN